MKWLSLLVSLSALQAQDLDQLKKSRKLIPASSEKFALYQTKIATLKPQEIKAFLQTSKNSTAKKNLLFMWTSLSEDHGQLQVLVELIRETEKNSLYHYFAQRFLKEKHLPYILKEAENDPQLYPLLSVYAHPKAFDFLYTQYKQDKSSIKTSWLQGAVSSENRESLLKIFSSDSDLALGLSQQILNDTDLSVAQAKRLLKKAQIKEITFTEDQKQELLALYQKLGNDLTFESKAIFDYEKYPILLHERLRNFIDFSHPIQKSVFRAVSLRFSKDNFLKYHKELPSLYSSSSKIRQKSLLRLKDHKDVKLSQVFVYLLNDPDSDIRCEAINALTELSEKHKGQLQSILRSSKSNFDDALNKRLSDSSHDVIICALELIGELEVESTYDLLPALCEHRNTQVILATIQCLELTEAPTGLNTLFKLLTHNDWNIRARAAQALSKYDNHKSLLSKVEKIYLKEQDPYVKEALFPIIGESSSQAIYDHFKKKLKTSQSKDEKLKAYTVLLELKSLKKEDVLASQKLFEPSEAPGFSKLWLKQASRFSIESKHELKLSLSKADEGLLSAAVDIAAKKKMFLLDHMDTAQLRKLSAYDLFGYLEDFKSLNSDKRYQFVSSILLDFEREDYTKVLTRFMDRASKLTPSKTTISRSNEIKLTKDQLKELYGKLTEKAKDLPELNQFSILLVTEHKFTDEEIGQWINRELPKKDRDKWIKIYEEFIGQLDLDAIIKHQKALIILFENGISYRAVQNHINKLPKDLLQEIYAHTPKHYKGNVLAALATHLSYDELVKAIDDLNSESKLSSYDVRKIMKPILKKSKPDTQLKIITLLGEYDLDEYDWQDIARSIKSETKNSLLEAIDKGDVKLNAAMINLLADKFSAKDFPAFKQFFIKQKGEFVELPYQLTESFESFKSTLEKYVADQPVSDELIYVLQGFSSIANSKKISTKLNSAIPELSLKSKISVFNFLERTNSKSKEFYALYLELLDAENRKLAFPPPSDEDEENSHSYVSYDDDYSPRPSKKKVVLVGGDLHKDLVTLLFEAHADDPENINLLQRIQKVASPDEFIDKFIDRLADDVEFIAYLPSGSLSDDNFRKLRKAVSLEEIEAEKLATISRSISKKLAKELIAEYQSQPEDQLLLAIIPLLKITDQELMSQLFLRFFKEFNLEKFDNNSFYFYDESSDQTLHEYNIDKAIRKLLTTQFLTHKNKDSLIPLLNQQELNSAQLLAMAIFQLKPSQEGFSKLLTTEDLSETDIEMLLQAAYISGKTTSKIFKLHEKMLTASATGDLKKWLTLSSNFHLLDEAQGDDYYDKNAFFALITQEYQLRDFLENPIHHPIPEKFTVLAKNLQDLKLSTAEASGDESLIQLSKPIANLSLSELLASLYKATEPMSAYMNQTIIVKIKDASIFEFSGFLNLVDSNPDIFQDPEALQSIYEAFNEQQKTFVMDQWLFSPNPKGRLIFLPHAFKDIKKVSQAQFILEHLENEYIANNHLPFYSLKPDQKSLFNEALESQLKAGQLVWNQKLMGVLSSLKVSHAFAQALDKELPKLDESLQNQALRVLSSAGPYYPEMLKLATQKLLEGEDKRIAYIDISFLFYSSDLIDKQKLKPVQTLLDDLLKAKKNNFLESSKKKGTLLPLYLDAEFVRDQYPSYKEAGHLQAWEIYLLDHFDSAKQETELKYFHDTLSKKDPRVLVRYLKARELSFDWLSELVKEQLKAPKTELN